MRFQMSNEMIKAKSAIADGLGMCAFRVQDDIDRDVVKSAAVIFLTSCGLYLCSLVKLHDADYDARDEQVALQNLNDAAVGFTRSRT